MHPRSSEASSILQRGRDTVLPRSTMSGLMANAVLDALPDSIAVLDQSGTIVAVNTAWTRFAHDNAGAAEATGMGVNYLAVCRAAAQDAHDDVARRVFDGLQAILSGTDMCFLLEYPCHCLTTRRWFLLRALPAPDGQAGAIVVHTDITARKLAEEGAIRQAQELETVFASLPDGAIMFDQQGRVVRASVRDQALAGPVCDESVDARARRLRMQDGNGAPLPHDQISAVRVLHGEVLTADQSADVYAYAPDGRRIELCETGAPIRDAGGRPAGGVLIYRDVTSERQTAHRYRSLLETAPDATLAADSDGAIRFLNRQAEVLFGYTREELLGQPVEVLIPERFNSVHRRHRAEYAAAPRTRPMGANLRLFGRRRDGSEFPIEVSLAPLQEDDEWQVIVSIRDVSEVQRVQAANQELHQLLTLTDTALSHLELDDLLPEVLDRLQDVMEVDDAVILLVSPKGDELRVRAARGLQEALGVGLRVPIGEGFAGRIAARCAPLIVDDLSSFPVFNSILRTRVRSAVGVPLMLGERALGVLHVGTAQPHHFTERDVQLLERVAERLSLAIERAQLYEAELRARAATERALARALEAEKRFRRLVNSGTIGIVVGDARHIIDANDAFLRMVGYTQADLQAGELTTRQLSPPRQDMLAAAANAVRAALMWGRSQPFEGEYTRKDGSHVPVLVGIALLEQEPPVFVSFVVDLTERKRLEREREEVRASELAARTVARQMDQFFAVASHDIRAPVSAVAGFVQLAHMRAAKLAEVVKAQDGKAAGITARLLDDLKQAEESIDRLVRMTILLFDVARARSGTFTVSPVPCDLAVIAREQVQAQRAAAPGRTIHLHLAGGGPFTVVADADRIGQVLANFIDNALKYSPDHQPVDVRVRCGKGRVRVAVRDRGPGLPPEEQVRVWEMFHRVPGVSVQSDRGLQSGSLGLGMHICKRIVELHPGGQVGIDSIVGRGSTFWFQLPLASEAAVAGAPACAPIEDQRDG